MKNIEELGISPAPWEEDQGFVISGVENVAMTIGDDIGIGARELANGRLIKAAPKLYEAMFNAVTAFDRGVGLANAMAECRAALAEASGERM